MSDPHRIALLEKRLAELRRRNSCAWERSIVEAACAAIERELLELGRRLRATCYWRGGAHDPGPLAALAAG